MYNKGICTAVVILSLVVRIFCAHLLQPVLVSTIFCAALLLLLLVCVVIQINLPKCKCVHYVSKCEKELLMLDSR